MGSDSANSLSDVHQPSRVEDQGPYDVISKDREPVVGTESAQSAGQSVEIMWQLGSSEERP